MPHALPEVEAVLRKRPDVADAMVVDHGDDGPIIALVVPELFSSGLELRDVCAAQVRDAPERVAAVLVTGLPENADDPAVILSGDYVYRYEPPATETERRLVALWNEVLGRQRTGILDDFLDLGGDSVSAVRLINRIGEELSVTLDIVEFFDFVHVRAVAEEVDKRGAGA